MSHHVLALAFWASATLVAYVYLGYPVLVAILARFFGRPPRLAGVGDPCPSVSVVIAAYNEEGSIDRRLREFASRIADDGLIGEIIFVSDGSTDRTAAIALEQGPPSMVRVIDLGANCGKAVALSTGCVAATNDVIVFADVRQTWAPDALLRLLAPFADPSVGAVSGDLVVETAPGVMAGMGLYWRYEKWLRANEGLLHSTVGATGAISAVRRELFQPIPPGTILDDVYWPLQVAMRGARVIHESRAKAFDRLPEKTKDEFRRKVRTLSGNFQLVAKAPATVLPWRNPIWIQFVSHKLGRLAAPWALIVLFISGLALVAVDSSARWFFLVVTLGELVLYALAVLGLAGMTNNKLVSASASFLVLNAASWASFWVWASGHSVRSWGKVSYNTAPTPAGVERA